VKPDLLTTSEAAQIIGMSAESIRRYSDQGLLRSHRTPGGQRRFVRTDVEALAAERSEAAS
jgi:excisionase family DNA binding protein